jgi:hypothetical protein
MNRLILDDTVVQASLPHFWPIQQMGQSAVPACLDLSFESGLLRLAHTPMQDWFVVTAAVARIAVPGLVNMDRFHTALAHGGALRNALIKLRIAAIIDRGVFAACADVKHELQLLSEQPGVDEESCEAEDPVLKPYARWRYAVAHKGEAGRPQVLAFPPSHIHRAKARDPDLVIKTLTELLADGLSPAIAKIGVREGDAGYVLARRDWIAIAVDSLVASIEEDVNRWPILPGEPFQVCILIDDDLYFIGLDTFDGVTVASATASAQALERVSLNVNEVGGARLAQGLKILARAASAN